MATMNPQLLCLCDNRMKLRWSLTTPSLQLLIIVHFLNKIRSCLIQHLTCQLSWLLHSLNRAGGDWCWKFLTRCHVLRGLTSQKVSVKTAGIAITGLYAQFGSALPRQFTLWVSLSAPYSGTAGEGLSSIVCYCELNQSFSRVFPWTNYLSCLERKNVKWKSNPLGGCMGNVEWETGSIYQPL